VIKETGFDFPQQSFKPACSEQPDGETRHLLLWEIDQQSMECAQLSCGQSDYILLKITNTVLLRAIFTVDCNAVELSHCTEY